MAPKAAASKKAAPAHPKYSAMVKEAIQSLNERSGSSRQAIFKFIDSKYKVGDSGKSHLRLALKRGAEKKELVNPKGHAGSYRLAPKAKVEKKPKVAKKKTVKKASTKKAAAPKKTSAKKPAAAKPAAAKKPAAKKPAAKKTSAKKATKKVAKKSAKATKA